ncbi:hypothetical protein THIX_90521 [Thiomonas sp. X19]|nr:hypothetical protein [Thiomonas sp. X19]SCC95746.1 hypothetical protein THIX_90521 [Thiomonas sp. X19]
MKLLVDMNLSPRWIDLLADARIKAARVNSGAEQRARRRNHGVCA